MDITLCKTALTLPNLPRMEAIHHVFRISMEEAWVSITSRRLTCRISTLLRFKRMKPMELQIHDETLANNRSVRTILIFWFRILLQQGHKVVTRTLAVTKWPKVTINEASSSPDLIKIHRKHLRRQEVSMSGQTRLRKQGNSCSSNFSQMALHNLKM